MSRKVLFTAVLVGVLATGVFAVSADDTSDPNKPATIMIKTDDYGYILDINDGRLNGTDVAAPVAVYYTYQTMIDDNGNSVTVPNGINLLSVDPVTDNGYLIAHVNDSDLSQILNGSVDSIQADGYALHYSKDSNWFWLTAPADSEGKVYTFQWQNQSFPVAQ